MDVIIILIIPAEYPDKCNRYCLFITCCLKKKTLISLTVLHNLGSEPCKPGLEFYPRMAESLRNDTHCHKPYGIAPWLLAKWQPGMVKIGTLLSCPMSILRREDPFRACSSPRSSTHTVHLELNQILTVLENNEWTLTPHLLYVVTSLCRNVAIYESNPDNED